MPDILQHINLHYLPDFILNHQDTFIHLANNTLHGYLYVPFTFALLSTLANRYGYTFRWFLNRPFENHQHIRPVTTPLRNFYERVVT